MHLGSRELNSPLEKLHARKFVFLHNIGDRFNQCSFILIQAVILSVGNMNGATPEEHSLIKFGFDLTGQFKYCICQFF